MGSSHQALLMAGGGIPLPGGATGTFLYHFDGESADWSGNGYNLGGPATYAAAVFGQGATFTAASAQWTNSSVGTLLNSYSGDFTMGLRVRYNGVRTGSGTFISMDIAPAFDVQITAAFKPQIVMYLGGSSYVFIGTAPAINDGAFHTLEIDRVGANLYYYVDGTQVDSRSGLGGSAFNSSVTTLKLGPYSGVSYAECTVDELFMFKGLGQHSGASYTPNTQPWKWV